MVSSDLDRLLTVTDRVGMLYRGELIFDGTTEEAQRSREPRVRQFVHGLTEGPLVIASAPPMRRLLPLVFALAAVSACTGAKSPQPIAEVVFDAVAPSVVAIVNDDTQDREDEIKEVETNLMGKDPRAPSTSSTSRTRKELSPHGTGLRDRGERDPRPGDGVLIVTAAHVILRPDRLKIRTRKGQTVDAELVRIDEVRDVAVLEAAGRRSRACRRSSSRSTISPSASRSGRSATRGAGSGRCRGACPRASRPASSTCHGQQAPALRRRGVPGVLGRSRRHLPRSRPRRGRRA